MGFKIQEEENRPRCVHNPKDTFQRTVTDMEMPAESQFVLLNLVKVLINKTLPSSSSTKVSFSPMG